MSEDRKSPEDFAYDNNLEIVEPADNELQCDLDSLNAVEVFKSNLNVLKQFVDVKRVTYTTSRSGNTHAYVVMKQFLPLHYRIALQACLGSDLLRELLSIKNATKETNTRPVFLFEVKT